MDATQLLAGVRLMPVVVIDDADNAIPLANALLAAGIQAIEITLRTPAALSAIEQIAQQVPEMLVGAGSVCQPDQFATLKNLGCAFAVSPGATEQLLQAANMPYVPGVATASESLRLLQAGYRLQKFFPAAASGGIAVLKAWSGPLQDVRFCPTGGITADNAKDYLALDCVACIGGSWFIPRADLQHKNFTRIEQLARQAMTLVNGVS